jgi:nucleotide-binding universal stress UspA family protein
VYKTIVVGTDGSATAIEAVRHAAQLAGLAGARLHIVHAYQPVSPLASIGPDAGGAAMALGVREAAEAEATRLLRDTARQLDGAGVEIETHLQVGDPADGLVETADAVGADVIVVGSKGMSGVRRYVLGSVPNKVSHHCPCHLLIVHTT